MPKEEHLESTTKKINELDKRSTKGDIEELIIPESNWKVAKKMCKLGSITLFIILLETLSTMCILQIKTIREIAVTNYVRTMMVVVVVLCIFNAILILVGYYCFRKRVVAFFEYFIFN